MNKSKQFESWLQSVAWIGIIICLFIGISTCKGQSDDYYSNYSTYTALAFTNDNEYLLFDIAIQTDLDSQLTKLTMETYRQKVLIPYMKQLSYDGFKSGFDTHLDNLMSACRSKQVHIYHMNAIKVKLKLSE